MKIIFLQELFFQNSIFLTTPIQTLDHPKAMKP